MWWSINKIGLSKFGVYICSRNGYEFVWYKNKSNGRKRTWKSIESKQMSCKLNLLWITKWFGLRIAYIFPKYMACYDVYEIYMLH